MADSNKETIWTKIAIALIPFAIATVIWGSNVEKRLAVMEERQTHIAELREEVKEIKQELQKLNLILAKNGVKFDE